MIYASTCFNHASKKMGKEWTLDWKLVPMHTSLTMALKSDEPRYCNKNAAIPKATDFNYQPEVHINLRGIHTICAVSNVSFLFFHDVMECMYWSQILN